MVHYHQRFWLVQLDFGPAAGGAAAASTGSGAGGVTTDVLGLAGAVLTGDIFNALRLTITEAFGDVGMGRIAASLAVKFYSPVTRLAVIRGPKAAEVELHAAIALVRNVRKTPAALRTLQVCGSLRALRSALTHWHRELVSGLRSSLGKDDVVLDESIFAALEAELDDAP